MSIVSCPRCGFSQPKDKYCANCGVDMDSYRPEQKPLPKRLASNSWFYLVLLFGVVVATVWFFIQHRPIPEATELAGSPIPVENSEAQADLQTPGTIETKSASGAQEQAQVGSPPAATAAAELAQALPQQQATGETRGGPPRLRISFYEVPADYFGVFYRGGNFGTVSTTELEQVREPRAEAKTDALGFPLIQDMRPETPIFVAYETGDSRLGEKEKVGVSVEVIPRSADSTGAVVDVALTVKFPEARPAANDPGRIGSFAISPATTKNLNVGLNANSGVYLHVALPHKNVSGAEKALLGRNEIFKVLMKPSFHADPVPSEVFVFLEWLQPQTNP